MSRSSISVQDIFLIVDEKKICEFCKSYALKNPDFADALKAKFAKEFPSFTASISLKEVKQVIDKCFVYKNTQPKMYDRYRYDTPDFLDWEKAGRALVRTIGQLKNLAKNQTDTALDGLVYLIQQVCNNYDEDWCDEREDFELNDMHLDDAINAIESIFEKHQVNKDKQLIIVNQLEKLSHQGAFSYEDFGVSFLIDNTRERLLTDDEHIDIRTQAFQQSTGYEQERTALDLWNYLLSLNREQQAITFYQQHSELNVLRTHYVDLLVEKNQYTEALTILNEGLKQVEKSRGITLIWERYKLTIYEKQKDKVMILKQLQVLFVEDNDAMKYYQQLKKLVSTEEWPTFLTDLINKRDWGLDADSVLSKIYVQEKWFDKLFDFLMTTQWNLLSTLEKYAQYFNAEQQTMLVKRIDQVLRDYIANPRNRNEYREFARRLITLRKTCIPGQTAADTIVADIRIKYKNRPAMLSELRIYDK